MKEHGTSKWSITRFGTFDNPTAPVLLDLNVDGQGAIPSVMQVTKQGWVYAFNRLTGEPIWPIV